MLTPRGMTPQQQQQMMQQQQQQQTMSPRGYTPQQQQLLLQQQLLQQQQRGLLTPRGGYAQQSPAQSMTPLSPRMGPQHTPGGSGGGGGTPLSPRQLTPQMVQQQLIQQQRLQQIAAQQLRLQQAASPLSPRSSTRPRPGPPASPPPAHQRLDAPPFSAVPASLQQHYQEQVQQYQHQQERLVLYQQQQSQQTAELHASRHAAATRRLSQNNQLSQQLQQQGQQGFATPPPDEGRFPSPSKRSPGAGLAAADALLERVRQERARAESSAGPSSSDSSVRPPGRESAADGWRATPEWSGGPLLRLHSRAPPLRAIVPSPKDSCVVSEYLAEAPMHSPIPPELSIFTRDLAAAAPGGPREP